MFLYILPLIAIFHIIILPKPKPYTIFNIGLFWSLIILIYFIQTWIKYSFYFDFQYQTILPWLLNSTIALLWGNLTFTYDGISLFFIGLSIILIPICILISYNSTTIFHREFIISLYIILIFLIGVFTITDILGFYILFEATLIPIFIMIGVWGSREQKIKAAFYFFFYTLIGSLFMLLSIFQIYSLTGTTNYFILRSIEIPTYLQFWLFIGFFLSLSIKIPMFPFHIWLPQAHVEAPISGSILLAGILLKLGGYGFIRFSFSLFPVASTYFSPIIITLSLIAIIYASFATCRQSDIKRLIAYSSIAHMGLITLSIFTHSSEGLIASILMMLAHGLISSGLFMITSVLYTRHHSRTIKYYRGLVSLMPIFSSISLVLILGNISFPLTFNFIAEFLCITAAFNYTFYAGIFSCLGILLGTIYSFYFYNRIYFGIYSFHLNYSRELLRFEFYSFIPIILLTIIFGIYPNLIINTLNLSSYINISL